MAKEKKVRKVKSPIQPGSDPGIERVETEYTSSQRMNMEEFHPNGQYSWVEASLTVRVYTKEPIDQEKLCESVDRRLKARIEKKIRTARKQLDSGSSI